MRDRISFQAGLEYPLPPGEFCPLCKTERIVLAYSIYSPAPEPQAGKGQTIEGLCCLGCGQQLLSTMDEIARARCETAAEDPRPRRIASG